MICLSYVKQIANLFSFLCKISGFSYKTSGPSSKFRTKTIDIVDGNFIERNISKYFSFMNSNHNLFFFIFDYLPVIYAVFVKIFWNSIFILLIPICAKIYFVVVSRLLDSFSNQLIKLITSFLNPFSDGKC